MVVRSDQTNASKRTRARVALFLVVTWSGFCQTCDLRQVRARMNMGALIGPFDRLSKGKARLIPHPRLTPWLHLGHSACLGACPAAIHPAVDGRARVGREHNANSFCRTSNHRFVSPKYGFCDVQFGLLTCADLPLNASRAIFFVRLHLAHVVVEHVDGRVEHLPFER
jgi:hypothetical protein